jgi:hypothetical protein
MVVDLSESTNKRWIDTTCPSWFAEFYHPESKFRAVSPRIRGDDWVGRVLRLARFQQECDPESFAFARG